MIGHTIILCFAADVFNAFSCPDKMEFNFCHSLEGLLKLFITCALSRFRRFYLFEKQYYRLSQLTRRLSILVP